MDDDNENTEREHRMGFKNMARKENSKEDKYDKENIKRGQSSFCMLLVSYLSSFLKINIIPQ